MDQRNIRVPYRAGMAELVAQTSALASAAEFFATGSVTLGVPRIEVLRSYAKAVEQHGLDVEGMQGLIGMAPGTGQAAGITPRLVAATERKPDRV